MQADRFKRTKAVAASSVIALVAAALIVGLSGLLLGPRPASSQGDGFEVASNASSFTIASSVYASPACAGAVVVLSPGIPRCMVFTVRNSLTVPITVQSITSSLDTTDYPAPPAVCSGSYLTEPTFSGSLTVAGGGSATTPGVPVELNNSGTNQSACENYLYHFLYSGTAQYTDSTATQLSASPAPSAPGQSVTFKATVTAANPSTDATVPSGTISFYSCPTATACSAGAGKLLGSGSIGAGGVATFSAASLTTGTTYVEAVYPASGTNFLSSTSNVVAQVVNPTTITTSSSLTAAPNPSTHGTAVTFTDTVASGSGTPTGSVTFYSCATSSCSTKTVLGTGTLSSGKTTSSTSTLPIGTTSVEAVYAGSGKFLGSHSNVVAQVVVPSVPAACVPGGYTDTIIGFPWLPVINGTNGNDFVYAFGGSYWINGFGRNDCIDTGDGNNVILDGDGNDGVVAGNGDNAVFLGNGDDKVVLGKGTNWVQVGNGDDTVTVGNGSHNRIDGGSGNETVFMGSGSFNTFSGLPHHTNVCHLPKPPASWHGTAAAYYHDTLTNCAVVTP